MLVTFISFFIGIAGFALLTAGAWLISPVAGLITGGLMCLVWSFLIAKLSANNIVK